MRRPLRSAGRRQVPARTMMLLSRRPRTCTVRSASLWTPTERGKVHKDGDAHNRGEGLHASAARTAERYRTLCSPRCLRECTPGFPCASAAVSRRFGLHIAHTMWQARELAPPRTPSDGARRYPPNSYVPNITKGSVTTRRANSATCDTLLPRQYVWQHATCTRELPADTHATHRCATHSIGMSGGGGTLNVVKNANSKLNKAWTASVWRCTSEIGTSCSCFCMRGRYLQRGDRGQPDQRVTSGQRAPFHRVGPPTRREPSFASLPRG